MWDKTLELKLQVPGKNLVLSPADDPTGRKANKETALSVYYGDMELVILNK